MTYPSLSVDSLLRLFNHAIGTCDAVPSRKVMNVINFLSLDFGYAPPSVIKAEMARAVDLGIIEVNQATTTVSFTAEAVDLVNKMLASGPMYPSFDGKRENVLWVPPEWNPARMHVIQPARDGGGAPPPPKHKKDLSAEELTSAPRKPRRMD